MTAPLRSQALHRWHPDTGPAPAASQPAPYRVTVTGTGTMQMLVADALLAQERVPVRIHVQEPGRPTLVPAEALAAPDVRADDVVRRVLADPRVEVLHHTGGLAAPAEPDPDASLLVGSRLRRRRLGATPRSLATATSAVVFGSVRAAMALARRTGSPRLRDLHLVLDEMALHRAGTATALESLLDLDVNVVVDPTEVGTGHRRPARCQVRRSLAALGTLGERFGTPDAVWLHLAFGWSPLQVVGRAHVEGVVLARAGDLRTVTAQALVLGRQYAVAALSGREGTYLIRAGDARLTSPGAVTPAEYVALPTGRYSRDQLAARRVADTLVRDALSGRLRPSLSRAAAGASSADSGNVVHLRLHRPLGPQPCAAPAHGASR